MYNTELGRFCAEHENWEELLVAEPYCFKIKEDGPYIMFSYDQIRSDFNLPIVREARGIIFRKGEWAVPVCWAFNKFGNYGESYVPDIDWDTAFVTEKIDGSLIKVWWDGSWKVSTNGTIDAWKAEINDCRMPNFGEYFITALEKYYDRFDDFFKGLETHRTYMFELVGPYNRVVVPYDEPDLYFLGARTNDSGAEFYCSGLLAGALNLANFKRPQQFPLKSLEDCIRVTEKFSWDQEGFVVVDAAGNRVKVKSPAYVMAHYARNNNTITTRHLIEVVALGETEEFLTYASDYEEQIISVKNMMDSFVDEANKAGEFARTLRGLSRAQAASVINQNPKLFHPVMFVNLDRDVSGLDYVNSWNSYKWERALESYSKYKENENDL